ncbi:hypothetical protein E2C01_025022 [Portunus trituberculatus]|uniref:Uncharacterized protein n=1 Tax=Portunus trituberculatus TaxID=210409 RepID=A0A5B7EEC1_PORTR|nr:hypothetical protein [Portunus trituberculatus]
MGGWKGETERRREREERDSHVYRYVSWQYAVKVHIFLSVLADIFIVADHSGSAPPPRESPNPAPISRHANTRHLTPQAQQHKAAPQYLPVSHNEYTMRHESFSCPTRCEQGCCSSRPCNTSHFFQ